MGTSEAAGKSSELLGKAESMPGGAERLAFLDQWICKRIQEAEAVEQRLAKRVEFMEKSEKSLTGLLDSLRKQVADACPILNQLSSFKDSAQSTVQDVLKAAKAQFSQVVELVRSRIDTLKEAERLFDNKAEEWRRSAQDILETSASALQRVLNEAKDEAGQVVDTLPKSVAARLEVFKVEVERTLGAAIELIAKKSEEIEGKSRGMAHRLEDQTQAGIAAVEREWNQRVRDRLADVEQQAKSLVTTAEMKIGELGGTFEKEVFEKAGAIQSRLSVGLEAAEKRSASVMDSMGRRMESLTQSAEVIAGVAESALKQGMDELRARAESIAGPIRSELEAQVSSCEERATELLESAQRGLARRAETFEIQIGEMAGRSREQLAKAVEEFSRTSMLNLDGVKLTLSRQSEAAADAVAQMQAQASKCEARISGVANSAQRELEQRMDTFEANVAQTVANMREQWEKARAEFARTSAISVEEARISLRREADAAVAAVGSDAGPMLRHVEERCKSARQQMEAQATQAKEVLSERLANLRQTGQTMIDHAEEKLGAKMRELRPQIGDAVESAERALGQRLHRMLENARSIVELNENQLSSRIDELRPRAAAAMRTLEAEMAERLAKLEEEAGTTTKWMEKKLREGVDALMERGRGTAKTQLAEIDDDIKSVEVEVFLGKNTEAEQRSAA